MPKNKKHKVVAWLTKYEYKKVIKKKGEILAYSPQARPNAIFIPLYDLGERYTQDGIPEERLEGIEKDRDLK